MPQARSLFEKLAKQLNDMRKNRTSTGNSTREKTQLKRRRIAENIIDNYAPLAERLGMQKIKEELDDIAFEILQPDARAAIIQRLLRARSFNAVLIPRVIDQILEDLDKNDIPGIVTGRE